MRAQIKPCKTILVQPTTDDIRNQLERIVASPQFAGSARLIRFLRYVVERSLAGEGARLKEFVVGTEVFDRGAEYDPRVDSIVRVEAGRLRRKLDEFYESAGSDDAVLIGLKKGSYSPSFEYRGAAAVACTPVKMRRRVMVAALAGAAVIFAAVAFLWTPDSPAPIAKPERVIAVLPFVPYGPDATAEVLGERLSEGVSATLVRSGQLRVVPSARGARYRDPRAIPDDIGRILGAQFVLRGRLTIIGDQLQVEAMLMDSARSLKPWVSSYTGTLQGAGELGKRIAKEAEEAAASMPVAAIPQDRMD